MQRPILIWVFHSFIGKRLLRFLGGWSLCREVLKTYVLRIGLMIYLHDSFYCPLYLDNEKSLSTLSSLDTFLMPACAPAPLPLQNCGIWLTGSFNDFLVSLSTTSSLGKKKPVKQINASHHRRQEADLRSMHSTFMSGRLQGLFPYGFTMTEYTANILFPVVFLVFRL